MKRPNSRLLLLGLAMVFGAGLLGAIIFARHGSFQGAANFEIIALGAFAVMVYRSRPRSGT